MKASHILVELKYSESLNEESYCQTCGYYKFYKNSNDLKKYELDIFIISSNLSPKEKHKWIRSIEDMVLEKMSIERRLKGLRAEDRLKGLRAEDRLKGLDIDIIEKYLLTLKRKKA